MKTQLSTLQSHFMNKLCIKNYCYLSKTKSVSTSNTFCRVQLSWCVSIDPKENLYFPTSLPQGGCTA